MQSKYSIWLTLALAIMVVCTPLTLSAAQHGGAPPSPPPQGAQPTPPQPPPPRDYSKESDLQRTILGAYRLTYTLTEVDGTKRIGSQRYAIVLDADAPRTSLNLGTKIPIETGEFKSSLPPQTQISYIDVGITIEARLRQFSNGLELNNRVVQSAVESQQSLLKTPVIRQTSLQSTVLLNENKPVILGNVDTPGSTHSLQIQVELTRLH